MSNKVILLSNVISTTVYIITSTILSMSCGSRVISFILLPTWKCVTDRQTDSSGYRVATATNNSNSILYKPKGIICFLINSYSAEKFIFVWSLAVDTFLIQIDPMYMKQDTGLRHFYRSIFIFWWAALNIRSNYHSS